ncbi:MAG TPA: formate dehydrogenase N subunit beta transmembrane domain-containing protein, partial [Candidatus Acidoferrales bacterium]|nr:formate dehydrogenase N subunit beta transmembrane domain-containing protein [Candidatus Acidoferrales bacterium]
AEQLRSVSGFADAGVYDPPGVSGTHVIYVLHDAKNPELYGGLPKDPHIPYSVRLWKGPLKWLGNFAMIGGLVGLAWHYMRYGPKKEEPIPPDDRRRV